MLSTTVPPPTDPTGEAQSNAASRVGWRAGVEPDSFHLEAWSQRERDLLSRDAGLCRRAGADGVTISSPIAQISSCQHAAVQ
jgi:hypothetical protein